LCSPVDWFGLLEEISLRGFNLVFALALPSAERQLSTHSCHLSEVRELAIVDRLGPYPVRDPSLLLIHGFPACRREIIKHYGVWER
jgi:hypothetical protein